MQIYKTFVKIALRCISYGFIYIGIFLGVSINISYSQNKDSAFSFEASKIDIALIDRDNSSLSKELYSYLNEKHKIKSMDDDKDNWMDEIFAHTVEYVVVIEEGFETQMLNGNSQNTLTSYSAPDSRSAYLVASQLESWMQNLSACLEAGYGLDAASAKALEISNMSADVSYLEDENTGKITSLSVFFHFIPYILLCVLINSLGPVLIIWNRPEIKARTAVSGVSSRARSWAIIGSVATYSLIVMGIITGASAIFYKKDFFSESTLYHLLNSVCFLFVSIATTFLVAQLSRKVTTLSIWSNLLGLSTSFLCGVFVSRSILPDNVVAFSKCLPTYWYINIADELNSFNGSISPLAKQSMIIQLLFAAAIMAVAFVIIRVRRQKND